MSQAIEIGTEVEINPQSDRSRKKLVSGIVSEIHTKNRNHPHGILVTLQDGRIGRVKRVIGSSSPRPPLTQPEPRHNDGQSQTLAELIAQGENQRVEFKSDILWSAKFTAEDIKNHKPQSPELRSYGKNASKVIIAKSLAGFLNADGGTLIVGVRENKAERREEIVGVGREFDKLRDATQDGYRRMMVDLIRSYFPSAIYNHMSRYFEIAFEPIDGVLVCAIRALRSDKRVFLRLNNNDHFFVRIDASTRELLGEEVVEYCESRFGGIGFQTQDK